MSEISAANYDRLASGMMYDEVTAILGSPGVLVSSHKAQIEPGIVVDAMETEVYRWEDEQGGVIQVMFGHGKLREKSQLGLD